uniref:Ring finger protein 24 n=1 Tax=Myotis myotis TaxID=51298 RepID=A0A7J7W0T8_MYOMY|nr:ring finger protein 24 [Myotis myotis]
MSWGFVRVSMPSTESALLSGWRFGKCVHCATCQFCSWPSCTVSRTVDPHRGPCQGQRTLYSSPQDQTVAGPTLTEAGGTHMLCVGCSTQAPAATSFAS